MTAWIRRPQEDEFDRWLNDPQAAYWRLIGEGGGGKTSLLNRFFEEAEDRRLPAVFLQANRCLDLGDRDGVTLLLNLDTTNTPEFDSARRLLSGVKTAFQAALDEAEVQTKANWDRISELAECGVEGAGPILKGFRDAAKVMEAIFGKGRDAARTQNLAKPEEFLLRALAKDMEKGGVWLVDTWEQADAKPFTTRLEFPRPGRLRTPLKGKPDETTLVPWLDGGLGWLFDKAAALVLIAGRDAPGALGGQTPPVRGVTERTQPWSEEEIGRYLRRSLSGIEHSDAPLSDLRRRTGGVPLLVDWVARLVGDVAREQGGEWRWADWPRLVRDFAENDRYGLINYAVERVVKHSTRIADVWKLALVDELTPAVADILFPAEGRDGPSGRALLRELQRLGLARPVRGQPDRWMVHDVTRSALESYAAYEEKLGGPETLETHRALAGHYDWEAGWTEREEEYWRTRLIGEESFNWAPVSILKEQFATLLRAAFHRSIVALHKNSELRKGNVKPGFIYELSRRLIATVTFSPPIVRVIAGMHLENQPKIAVEQLLGILRDEGGLEGGFEPGDAYLFHGITIAQSISELGDINIDALIDKYRDSVVALLVIAEKEELTVDLRSSVYSSLMKEHPEDPRVLRSYANFVFLVNEDYDFSEKLHRKAIEIAPNRIDWIGDLAIFLELVKKNHEDAEIYYRRAVEADPNPTIILRNFIDFLVSVRGNYEEAERYLRRAVEADPNDAYSLANLAGLLFARDSLPEAESFWQRALAVADTGPPGISLKLSFYAYAHLPDRREEALREVTARLERGERSPNFDLSRNVEAARRQGHPMPDLVAELARRIGE